MRSRGKRPEHSAPADTCCSEARRSSRAGSPRSSVPARRVICSMSMGRPKRRPSRRGTRFATWRPTRRPFPSVARSRTRRCSYCARISSLAAPGEPGEIWIGGPGLATGYINASAELAGRFVERGIAQLPARRLYRSGDRARWREDGSIEFLGRRDRQVKIRGYRIELEEIEAAIARLPMVQRRGSSPSAAIPAIRGNSPLTSFAPTLRDRRRPIFGATCV